MPWDFFCPVCSNILDADMTEDPDLMSKQWQVLQNDLYLCDQCNNIVSFDHNIIDINTFIPKNHTVTIHVTSSTHGSKISFTLFSIKNHLIDHPGIHVIDNIIYQIIDT